MNKKLAIVLAVFIAAVAAVMPSFSKVKSMPKAEGAFASTARAAMLVDADTGVVVFEKNAGEHLQIASMVKIMTLGLAFDEIQKREIPLDTTVTVSQNASSMGGSQAFLQEGLSYKLDELLKSIVVASANDSCVAVAEFLYGSVDEFVSRMNERAAQWGMTDTVFVNCTGLPKDGQYSCAKDVVKMFSELIKHEQFFNYAKVWTYDMAHPDGRTTLLTNTNKLVRFYEGCDGGKTGYTDAARSCVTVTAKRGDTRLICAVVGAENSKTRNKEVSELLNYGFANFSTEYAVRCGDMIGEYPVAGGKSASVKVLAADDRTVFTQKGQKSNVKLVPVVSEIKAPVVAGQSVGELIVTVDGREYASVPLVAAESCAKKGYLDIVGQFIKNW